MNSLRLLFSFPLLAKELIERAARPRTYVMRVTAALLLYVFFWLTNRWIFTSGITSPSWVLGQGERMFRSLTELLMVGIYFFVPAMLSGVVTQEKERDSLAMLLLTELRPWQIVLQKYAAGLIPALSLLLLALPLGAVAYTYGGFSAEEFALKSIILILAVLQIGALAIWCSCRFRSTVTAFMATYFIAAALAVVPFLLDEFTKLRRFTWEWLLFAHLPPAPLTQFSAGSIEQLGSLLVIPATTLAFLALAAYDLPRRAFLPSRNLLREIFQWIDRLMQRANRLAGNITFGSKVASLPVDEPLLWRERRSRALARPEYLVRLLLLVEFPVIIISLLMPGPHSFNYQQYGLSLFAAGLGSLVILVICVTGANTFVTERVNQTMEVLLTTPLSAHEIVRQKARAMRPLLWVLGAPLATIFLIEAWTESSPYLAPDFFFGTQEGKKVIAYVVVALLSLLVYLPLLSWIALWVGMFSKTRIRAIITVLSIVLGWCIGPAIVCGIMNWEPSRNAFEAYAWLSTPLTMPAANETNSLDDFTRHGGITLIAVNFAVYLLILVNLRWHCLAYADRYLRGRRA